MRWSLRRLSAIFALVLLSAVHGYCVGSQEVPAPEPTVVWVGLSAADEISIPEESLVVDSASSPIGRMAGPVAIAGVDTFVVSDPDRAVVFLGRQGSWTKLVAFGAGPQELPFVSYIGADEGRIAIMYAPAKAALDTHLAGAAPQWVLFSDSGDFLGKARADVREIFEGDLVFDSWLMADLQGVFSADTAPDGSVELRADPTRASISRLRLLDDSGDSEGQSGVQRIGGMDFYRSVVPENGRVLPRLLLTANRHVVVVSSEIVNVWSIYGHDGRLLSRVETRDQTAHVRPADLSRPTRSQRYTILTNDTTIDQAGLLFVARAGTFADPNDRYTGTRGRIDVLDSECGRLVDTIVVANEPRWIDAAFGRLIYSTSDGSVYAIRYDQPRRAGSREPGTD